MCKSAAGVLSLVFTLTLFSPSANAKEFVPKWLEDKCESAKSEPSCLGLSKNPSAGIGWRVYECRWNAGRCVVDQDRLDLAAKALCLELCSFVCTVGFLNFVVEYLYEPTSHPAHAILSAFFLTLGGLSWAAGLRATDEYARLEPKKADASPTP